MRIRNGAVLCAALVASSGCVPKRKYTELQDQYERLGERYEALDTSASGLTLEVSDLEGEVGGLREENTSLGSFTTGLLQEFRPELESNEIELLVFPDRTSLVFAEDVTFATGSDQLTQDGRDTVRRMATFLKAHPGRRFHVEGHTDAVPISNDRFANNWELGAARSVAVVEELIAGGVRPEQLSAATYGEHAPLRVNGTDPGRSGNRRVEITFQPTLEELPGHEALLSAARVIRAEPEPAPPAPQAERAAPEDDRPVAADIELDQL